MSLLNEFNKQLSSASEQLERLERLEAEQQQEDGKEIKKKQQQQQPQSIKQRTPHGVVGYSGLHLKKNPNFSSAAATPNMDPIAAKHLQPNPIRYAKTTITDRLDSNYRALSSLQDQASPTRIAVENDRNRKKFEYLNNKIKALDERVSSMNNIHSSNATPSISGIEAIDFEIQELKAKMKKVLENDLRSDQDSNKSKYASPSLQMDHVYDVVYSRLRTQLQDIVHEVFQTYNGKRVCWQVPSSRDRKYTCLKESCPCRSYFELAKNCRDRVMCKHLLAISLANAFGIVKKHVVTDEQYVSVVCSE